MQIIRGCEKDSLNLAVFDPRNEIYVRVGKFRPQKSYKKLCLRKKLILLLKFIASLLAYIHKKQRQI
jgi:hypothetical protein